MPSRYKLPAVFLIVGLGLSLSSNVNSLWEGQKMAVRAAEAAQSGNWGESNHWIELAKERTPEDPEVYAESAQLDFQRGNLLQAAADLEKSARLNPYRPATWSQIQMVYQKMGLPEQAQRTLQQSLQYTVPK